MADNKLMLAHALENLENEVGLDELTKLLTEILLASSARLHGDKQVHWQVDTQFVKGQVTTITHTNTHK